MLNQHHLIRDSPRHCFKTTTLYSNCNDSPFFCFVSICSDFNHPKKKNTCIYIQPVSHTSLILLRTLLVVNRDRERERERYPKQKNKRDIERDLERQRKWQLVRRDRRSAFCQGVLKNKFHFVFLIIIIVDMIFTFLPFLLFLSLFSKNYKLKQGMAKFMVSPSSYFLAFEVVGASFVRERKSLEK